MNTINESTESMYVVTVRTVDNAGRAKDYQTTPLVHASANVMMGAPGSKGSYLQFLTEGNISVSVPVSLITEVTAREAKK